MMKKRTITLSTIIIFIELLVLLFSFQLTDFESVRYSLAARYSARLTLFLFEGLLIWIALRGLKSIFAHDMSREWFVLILVLIAVNHLIHFIYLYLNHAVNDYELFTLRTMGGMLGYAVMLSAPFLLWPLKRLSKTGYAGILLGFMIIQIIAMVSYIGRWNKDLPLASSKETYIGIMLVIGMITVFNVYKLFAERKRYWGEPFF